MRITGYHILVHLKESLVYLLKKHDDGYRETCVNSVKCLSELSKHFFMASFFRMIGSTSPKVPCLDPLI